MGVSSDADHIITPSAEGPTAAIQQALARAGVDPAEISPPGTSTPPPRRATTRRSRPCAAWSPTAVLVTARKGTFGHGMAAGGGWELTAQYLGYERGQLFPTPLTVDELNPQIAGVHGRLRLRPAGGAGHGPAGKLSHGHRRHQRLYPVPPLVITHPRAGGRERRRPGSHPSIHP